MTCYFQHYTTNNCVAYWIGCHYISLYGEDSDVDLKKSLTFVNVFISRRHTSDVATFWSDEPEPNKPNGVITFVDMQLIVILIRRYTNNVQMT